MQSPSNHSAQHALLCAALPPAARVSAGQPVDALPVAAAISSKDCKVAWLAHFDDVIWMLIALQWQGCAHLASGPQLVQHKLPHGSFLGGSKGVGIANQHHAMHSSGQQYINPVGSVQKASSALLVAANE